MGVLFIKTVRDMANNPHHRQWIPVLPTLLCLALALPAAAGASAQTLTHVSSSEARPWQTGKVKLAKRVSGTPVLTVSPQDSLATLRGFGTCFNELGWDALNLLPEEERNDVMRRLFNPSGDLRFCIGRIPMNASDYARDWYSCDEVSGDFDLVYFNIERDKTTLIPYIHMAQEQNPDILFWTSPWSPPSWMKINHDYPVLSNERYNTLDPKSDTGLWRGSQERREDVFPQRLALSDQMIQDPRYLQTYANYFCRFLEAYEGEGIKIRRVMFQNESWSYTPYPGCAWTAEGIIRFNAEYLGPTLLHEHPDVEIYLGTINTNRYDVIDQVMSDERVRQTVKGLGLQWEGSQILQRLKEKYPDYSYVQTESECGGGSFDWKAAEHTFSIMNRYLGYGCEDYTFWNAILAGDGTSPWGWKQNALIQVNSQTRTATLTPEYYAVKHYSNVVAPGSKLLGAKDGGENGLSVIAYLTPEGKYAVIAGNLSDEDKELCVKLGNAYLSVTLPAHTMHSFMG